MTAIRMFLPAFKTLARDILFRFQGACVSLFFGRTPIAVVDGRLWFFRLRGIAMMTRALTLTACFALLAMASGLQAADVIVPAGSEWKWLHPTDGADPASTVKDFHTTFMKADFDDSKWNTAKDSAGPHGGFGYGEEGFTGQDIGNPDTENRKSAYFRHKFKTEKGLKDLVLKLQRDDGVIIYLDGKEVGRDNVGGGDDKYDLYASETISAEGETTPVEVKLEGSLEPGEHILAISLHNRPGGSSDLRIAEISLEGTAQ